MEFLFGDCSSLTTLGDLSSWDTSNVTDMLAMFENCSSLTTLDLSGWNTSNVTDMSFMFHNCDFLTNLDLSSFDTSNLTNVDYMFLNCLKLQEVTFGASWNWIGTDGYLPTPDSTYISGADGKWYDTDGNGYAPADIPTGKAATYYASKDLVPGITISGNAVCEEQGVAARSLPADGEDEASAASSVEVSLELAGDGSRAAGPVAVTLSGDAGDARAVLGKEGAKVALAPGRYLVSCLPALEADGSMADAPAPFWVEASEGMEPVEIAIGSASRRPAADVQERAAAIESWLAAAAGSVPQADAEALRSAAASALSACQATEAVSEASDGSE